MMDVEKKLSEIINLTDDIRTKSLRLFEELRDLLLIVANNLDAEKREVLINKTLTQVNRMIICSSTIINDAKSIIKDLEMLDLKNT
jgi:hypothetical protein